MDTPTRRVALHIAGVFLASVGFFLSVLSVFFNIMLNKALVEHSIQAAHTVLLERVPRKVHIPVEALTAPKSPSSPRPNSITTPPPPIRDSEVLETPSVPLPVLHAEATLSPKHEGKRATITFLKGVDADSMLSPRKAHSMPSVRVLVHSPIEESNHTFLSQLNPLREKRPKPNQRTSLPLVSPHLESKPPLLTPSETKPPDPQAVKKKNASPFRKDSIRE
ncbi:hypothetical protein H0H92_014041 [Tricholoma furcatifolium]|nr:hypothetical protein H0H92_014041 [Tricholoma furcatifolium]